ncbi:MAG: zinc-ribbon domain-containing protein [Thermoanaerobaculia bacterium]
MLTCRKCGKTLEPDVQFCPRCGTPVAAAPPTQPGTQPRPGRGTWWIVPLVIVGLVVIAWLLLAGLPFGREERRVTQRAETETIAEGTAPPAPAEAQPTGTIIDVTEPPVTTTTAPPPVVTTIPPVVTTAPPVVTTQPPVVTTPPVVVPPPTPPPPQPRNEEISEDEASATLRGFITSRNYYSDVAAGCVQVRSQGYRNVGYTFSVWDACVSGGGSRMLGRWRVDAKTREVFRQRDDGRYLRP